MHKLFQEAATAIVDNYSRMVRQSMSHTNRIKYIQQMKAELQELKEAYGVIYIPSNQDEHIFDINTTISIN